MIRPTIVAALAGAVVLVLLGTAGCERTARESGVSAPTQSQSQYVCPMHPDVTSGEPGRCPICGMDLVRQEPASASSRGEPEILYYRHPHNPEVTSEVPKKDEMGMDYVPVYAGGGDGGVTVSPEVRHNLGVTTEQVVLGSLPRTLQGVGFVTWDEGRLVHVHTRAEGWVERWNISAVGDAVKKGEILFELYSPAMATAEEEFVQALKMDSPRLVAAAARKLEALGISPAAIERLRDTREAAGRIPFRAETDGTVVELAAREGMYVQPMTEVLVIADLDRVWVEADVLASKGGWLKRGLPAVVTVESLPGREWTGEVTWVYPQVDPVSRATRVRMAFDNPDGTLMPNAWASVHISEPSPEPVLHIPREAVIRSGRGERVIVETAPGRFAPRAIEAGYESGDRIAVLAGLAQGETVVTSGQFMLDSEASLRGELERLAPAGAPPPAGQEMPGADNTGGSMSGGEHAGHDMEGMDHSGHDHGAHDGESTDHSSDGAGGMDHSQHDAGGTPGDSHAGHVHGEDGQP